MRGRYGLAGVIARPYQDEPQLQRQLRARFRETGYVKLPGLLGPDTFRAVCAEVARLHASRARKDFVMPGFDTDRRMSVLSGKDVVARSAVIANLYACQELREWIAGVTATPVHPVPHEEEFLVLNFLDGPRDTHGWHLDDPRYALIVVVESPAPHRGGCLEYVPDWKRRAREQGFDPCHDLERGVQACRRQGWLRSDTLKPGDCYLLDAGEVLHRVSPLSADGRRKALNLAFDDRRFRVYGDTARRLYA